MSRNSTNSRTTEPTLTSDEKVLQQSLQDHLDSQVDNLDYTVTVSSARLGIELCRAKVEHVLQKVQLVTG